MTQDVKGLPREPQVVQQEVVRKAVAEVSRSKVMTEVVTMDTTEQVVTRVFMERFVRLEVVQRVVTEVVEVVLRQSVTIRYEAGLELKEK